MGNGEHPGSWLHPHDVLNELLRGPDTMVLHVVSKPLRPDERTVTKVLAPQLSVGSLTPSEST